MQAVRAYKHKPGTPYRKKTEESEQQRFITWFKRLFPHVIIYTDFAAGLNLSDNERIRMMKQRSRDGMPDLYIDHPMTHVIDGQTVHYHGARFEFKKTGEEVYKKDGVTLRKASYKREYFRYGKRYIRTGDHLEDQANTLEAYNDAGYYARFVLGIAEAQKHAAFYMGVILEDPDSPF